MSIFSKLIRDNFVKKNIIRDNAYVIKSTIKILNKKFVY